MEENETPNFTENRVSRREKEKKMKTMMFAIALSLVVSISGSLAEAQDMCVYGGKTYSPGSIIKILLK